MEKQTAIALAIVAWLVLSGAIQVLRGAGALSQTRTYDWSDAVGTPVEVGLVIWGVLYLGGIL